MGHGEMSKGKCVSEIRGSSFSWVSGAGGGSLPLLPPLFTTLHWTLLSSLFLSLGKQDFPLLIGLQGHLSPCTDEDLDSG